MAAGNKTCAGVCASLLGPRMAARTARSTPTLVTGSGVEIRIQTLKKTETNQLFWMSTNSKFETARCDGESDGDEDNQQDSALVSTILGSDDLNDDLSSCMDSDHDDAAFGDGFDWVCANA